MCLPSWPTSFIYLKWIVFCGHCVVAKSCLTLWLFMIPWTAAHQAPLSSTVSWSLLKFMSIESAMHPTISSSVIPVSSRLQSFPASGPFLMSQIFASSGQSIRALASASILPMNIQDWSPCSPRDSEESSPTPLFESISSPVLSLLYGPTLTSVHDHRKLFGNIKEWS